MLFASGCTVDYSLIIDEDNLFHESVVINSENNSESQELYDDPWPIKVYYNDPDSGEYPEKLDGVEYYVNDVFLEHDLYRKKLSYDFKLSEFANSNLIQSCYEHFYVTENKKDQTITLSTSAEFLCMINYPALNEVAITIEVKNPVITSNADFVDGNVYTWNITRENYETRGIILTFQKGQGVKKENEVLADKVVLAFVVLGIFFIFLFFLIKYNVKQHRVQ